MRLRPCLCLCLLPLLVVACGRNGITNQPASLVSSSSLWLRNTYDTDPSVYVGRFVPAGVTELDESNTMVLACSKYISSRFIDGGGVEYSEEMQVSTEIALKIGLPVVASGSAGYQGSRTARARYKLTGKLVAEITDPEGFAACCKAQPDQCTDRFIGEFIQGTGSLHHDAERSIDLEGQGTNPTNGLSGEGGVSRTAEWQRAAEFPDPVYFAFKINPTPYTQGLVDTCPSWVDDPPAAEGGVYVVGSADEAKNESKARSAALQAAGNMAAQATGVRVGVRPESWCVTADKNRRGRARYSARVLGFVSDADIANAREQARIAAEQEQARQAAEREERRLAAEQAQARLAEQARLDAEADARRPDPISDPTTDPTLDPGMDPSMDPGTDPTTNPTTNPSGKRDVDRIVAAVEAEMASSDQLSALTFSVKQARLSAAEARRVLDLFSMSEDKLSALQIMRDHVEDPENWQVLVEGFSFSDDREAARNLAP
ncbi:DUF4476 domain-containing protein [Nannocystaceae bacterium ST9]